MLWIVPWASKLLDIISTYKLALKTCQQHSIFEGGFLAKAKIKAKTLSAFILVSHHDEYDKGVGNKALVISQTS
ncbi:hypothetical protein OA92_10125 [Marinomonas sp. SBI22]|jgi:hypothetical protein|nr:hypothetical protein OA92_10125 [Marinomonas sp. SBI22]KZM44674.1 hypothetical protein OA91_09550 [Marinomonas sp. SBI8L]